MASQEYDHSKIHDHGVDHAEVETQDRGMFDFLVKKKEGEEKHDHHPQEEVDVSEFNEKVKIEEEETKAEEEGEKKHGLVEKLHRTGSSSSSSSDEEGEGEEKKKKKKGHTLRETIDGERKEEGKFAFEHPPSHLEEKKYGEGVFVDAAHPTDKTVVHPEEKKGLIEKIKDKLPGHKKTEEVPPLLTHTPAPTSLTHTPTPTTESVPHHEVHEGETGEKKSIMEKIKEKLPGHHAKEVKEKESGPY